MPLRVAASQQHVDFVLHAGRDGGDRQWLTGDVLVVPLAQLSAAHAAAVVAPSGFLLFLRQTGLFAQAFDFKRLELSGNPFPVAEQAAFVKPTKSELEAVWRAIRNRFD